MRYLKNGVWIKLSNIFPNDWMKISTTENGSVCTNYEPLREAQTLRNACISNRKLLKWKHAAAIDEKQRKSKKNDQKLTYFMKLNELKC